MIAELKAETQSVLVQVRDATGDFREIDRLDAVLELPEAVSASVTALAHNARDFRLKLGYDIAFHETRAETETVDALVAVDQITRDIAAANAPVARAKLSALLNRYPQPVADNQKPLWHYITSVLLLCNRSEEEAKAHLQRAKSLESAGKKSEALREYREIYRLYPNQVAAEKIRQLENQPR
jgi:hypothetical protein